MLKSNNILTRNIMKKSLEKRFSSGFKEFGWKLYLKLENKEKISKKFTKYLVKSNHLSYDYKGHFDAHPFDSLEQVEDSKGKRLYFVLGNYAVDYMVAKYVKKNNSDSNARPSGLFYKEALPPSAS